MKQKKLQKMLNSICFVLLGFSMAYTATPLQQAEGATLKRYETTHNLNLREGASTNKKRILTIPRGANVSFISSHRGWFKVKYSKQIGFVSSKYLKRVGAPLQKHSSPNSNKSPYIKKMMDVEVTAYTFNHGANITASGRKLQVGYVAAPRDISFGSIVDIPSIEKRLGVKQLTVYDRGGAIKRLGSNKIRIDVAFPTYSEAIKFGRKTYRNVPVYVKK